VRSPVFGAAEQAKAIDAVLAKAGLTGPAANVVRVMARNRRLFAAPALLGAYNKLLAAHRGEETAEVTVAQELTAAQAKELGSTLNSVVGKNVAIHTVVDPSILGGMIVRVGSRQIDTSLRTKLSSLKLALKEVG
jgi:F-type H+-transporting ATPase subunit delta